jgi:uncharacterized protein
MHAWYSLHDLEALGERGAVLGGELRVAELTRLKASLHAACDTAVEVEMQFGRAADGLVTMRLAFAARLPLTCQRCLEPVEQVVDETIEWVVVGSEAEAARVADDLEPLVLADDRLQMATLVEDELIVSLPMAPRHASIDECGALAHNLDGILEDQDAERVEPTLEA